MEFILASTSPRRRDLISLLGIPWRVEGAMVDELSITDIDPVENVRRTALLKVNAVAANTIEKTVIIAADTTVSFKNRMLNKPADEEEARIMLRILRENTHQVHTGIAVVNQLTNQTISDVTSIDVPMRDYSDEEIDKYVDSGDPLDKAGAYAIQHAGFRPVKELNGCYAGVVGLPLCHLVRALHQTGIRIDVDIAERCQKHNNYLCPVFTSILEGSG